MNQAWNRDICLTAWCIHKFFIMTRNLGLTFFFFLFLSNRFIRRPTKLVTQEKDQGKSLNLKRVAHLKATTSGENRFTNYNDEKKISGHLYTSSSIIKKRKFTINPESNFTKTSIYKMLNTTVRLLKQKSIPCLPYLSSQTLA